MTPVAAPVADELRKTAPLQCMEIRGGSHAVTEQTSTPGLDLWVYSRPFEQAHGGGDVHYVSLCGGGLLTRMILADVAGHGAAVADLARDLRDLMRKNINRKTHDRLVRALNREFTGLAKMRRFATAVVATFLAGTQRMMIANAGHPRPVRYEAQTRAWSVCGLIDDAGDQAANLPFGIDDSASYSQYSIDFAAGDLVLFYTDALLEAADARGRGLGEAGLLELLRSLPADDAQALAERLPKALANYREGAPAQDDETFLLIRSNGAGRKRLSLGDKLNVYAKVFGLKRV